MMNEKSQIIRNKEIIQWEAQNNIIFKYKNRSTYPIVLTDGDELYCGSEAEDILLHDADSVKISVYPGEVIALGYSNGFYQLIAGE